MFHSQQITCPATVHQEGDVFITGPHNHLHPAKQGSPGHYIIPVFNSLQQKAATGPLRELTNYISSSWLQSDVWPITSWSVFGHYTRTNNLVEGWHFRMNKKAKKAQLSFYMLISLLYDKAVTVNVPMYLVSENKLTCQECKKYHKAQSAISHF